MGLFFLFCDILKQFDKWRNYVRFQIFYTVKEQAKILVKDPNNYEARAEVMWVPANAGSDEDLALMAHK